jgi:hypothetical protein
MIERVTVEELLLRAEFEAGEHEANALALTYLNEFEAVEEALRRAHSAKREVARLRKLAAKLVGPRGLPPYFDPADPRPVLYVDVDGVLNVFEALDHQGEQFRADEGRFLIRVPDGTRERIAELSEHFQMAWGTAWERKAPRCLSPHLGFGADWPVADRFHNLIAEGQELPLGVKLSEALTTDVEDGEEARRTWKLPGLLEHASTHDLPFAWLDDDLCEDAYAAFEQLNTAGRPVMLAQPNPVQGLGDEHVEALIGWAQSLPSQEALTAA